MFPGFVVAKISRLRLFRKTLIKGFTRILYLFWKWSKENKLRELLSIRCLTCVIPMVSQSLQKTGALFILIKEFCNRGRDRKWSFDTIFPSKKVSDQISAIPLTKVSSILRLWISFLLRFPNSKKVLPPNVPSAKLKKFFHLPWFPESRHFLIQLALSYLLKELISIIFRPLSG